MASCPILPRNKTLLAFIYIIDVQMNTLIIDIYNKNGKDILAVRLYYYSQLHFSTLEPYFIVSTAIAKTSETKGLDTL